MPKPIKRHVKKRPLVVRKRRIPRLRLTNVFTFSRFTPSTNIAGVNAADTLGAIQHELVDIDQSGDPIALFEFYRIAKVEIWFRPVGNFETPTTVAIQTNAYEMWTSVDLDDGSSPGSLIILRARQGVKTHYGLKPFKVTYKPKPVMPLYNGAFAGFAVAKNVWVSTAYPTVRYYGLKYGIPGVVGTTTAVPAWTYDMRYTIQCKQPI